MRARGGTEAVRNVGWIGLAENRGPGPGSQPGKKVAGFWPVRNHTKTLYLFTYKLEAGASSGRAGAMGGTTGHAPGHATGSGACKLLL
jgi:hypothetical protein